MNKSELIAIDKQLSALRKNLNDEKMILEL